MIELCIIWTLKKKPLLCYTLAKCLCFSLPVVKQSWDWNEGKMGPCLTCKIQEGLVVAKNSVIKIKNTLVQSLKNKINVKKS